MSIMLRTVLLLTTVIFGGSLWAIEKSPVETKKDSLHQLQELRNTNVKRLENIDRALDRKIEDTATTNLENEVAVLKAEKHEHLLRQEFLDRLIFQIDTKYTGGDLRLFLEQALLSMAKVDAASSASAGDGIWKFLKYSADAIHRLPEQKENILSFLEGYMNHSVANPIRPDEYLQAAIIRMAPRANLDIR
jgi:hypothetical protein